MPIKFIRKPNRLPFKQVYNSNNSFFVTVCVEGRICYLSEILKGKASLSPTGKIVEESWLSMVDLINDIQLENFVIMPNHFHGIITFLDTPTFKNTGKVADLSQIFAMFKSKSTNLIRRNGKLLVNSQESSEIPLSKSKESRGTPLASQKDQKMGNGSSGQASLAPTNLPTFQWQKSFYDHVIRDEKDLHRIQEYIYNNPLQWELDILNPKNEDKYQKWLVAKTKDFQFS